MANWSETWNNKFLDHLKLTGQPRNDAWPKYEVRIEPVTVPPGQEYWRCIGVHHLTGDENKGNHHGYADALDENGKRLNGTVIRIFNRNSGKETTATIDKPTNEAGTNFPIWDGDSLQAYVDGPLLTDRVEWLRSTHPDDPGTGNTWGHHSFYFTFQRTTAGSTPPPEEPPEEPDPPPTDPAYTITSRVAYDITGANGDFIATTTSLHTARQIVASLVLFQASSRDSRLEEYVKAIEKWQRGER